MIILPANRRQALAVDWRNPITRDLVVAWSPTQYLKNLATGRPFTLTAGAADDLAPDYNAFGIGYKTNNAVVTTLANTTDGPSSKTEFSILSVNTLAVSPSSSSNNQTLVTLGDGTGSSGNDIQWDLNTSGTAVGYRNQIWIGASYVQVLSTTLINDPGSAHVGIAVNSVAQSRWEVWLDGGISSTGTARTVSDANNNFVTLFNNSNGFANQRVATPVNLILIWNRALSVDECVKMSAQPLRIFASTPKTVYRYGYAGAGGAVQRPVIFTAT